MADSTVVTRFAPSPTGYLHVGGARTALFNWAYARRHGGRFILRIEDTDAARSTDESTKKILEDLRWLGLNWDEGPEVGGPSGPYFQSQRGHLYKQYLEQLAAIGRAYRCFKTAEELTAAKAKAKTEGRAYKYDPAESLNLSKAQTDQLIAAGKPFVWRFRMPDADVTVNDLVLGDVTIKAAELEDFVIFKSDGGPTFHFANVVDDATMKVTHVLRAQEHLMNTPKHVAMFDALGIKRPSYAHMPLIFNSDGSKMSKRDKAKVARAAAKERKLAAAPGVDDAAFRAFLDKKSDAVEIALAVAGVLNVILPEIDVHDFRRSGYLPSVILNYLALLGWSPGNDLERFDLDFLAKNFDLERIGKSNARFDRAKLLAFNTEAIGKLTPDEFFKLWREHLAAFHPVYLQKFDDARLRILAEAYRPRSRTLDEPSINGMFFVVADGDVQYDPKAVEKVLKKENGAGLAMLRELAAVLTAISDWNGPALHAALEAFAQRAGKGMGDIAQPLRVAVSGSTVSPPIQDTLALLGKNSTLARINRALTL
ncbi:MAG: glutamate--tRNA ligase [Planctomycetes bacterium]|nr:glutamate--tRNA ligase [Planctomycetota bacterium]